MLPYTKRRSDVVDQIVMYNHYWLSLGNIMMICKINISLNLVLVRTYLSINFGL